MAESFGAAKGNALRLGCRVLVALASVTSTAIADEVECPAVRYLDGIAEEVAAARRDLPRLTKLAEQAAGNLLAGGELIAPPVAPWWASELTGRAGGPMRVMRDASKAGKRDVALFALPHPALADLKTAAALQSVLDGSADLYVLGPDSIVSTYRTPDGRMIGGRRKLACLGGPPMGAGLFPRQNLPPVAPFRPVAELVRGWVFIGEVVAACTRQGKMPTIWQSIAIPGSRQRNASIKTTSGPHAGQFPFLHADRRVPPMPPGKAGAAYLDAIARYLRVLRSQADRFARAGQWLADARRSRHRVVAIAQGHSPVLIVGRDNETRVPIKLYAGDYVKGIVPHAKPGDAVVALCYMAIPVEAVIGTLDKGCRVVIACPYGLPDALKDRPNLLWLDTAWQVGDAAVDVPGYDVKMLPASAVMQMSALYALVAETVGQDQQRNGP